MDKEKFQVLDDEIINLTFNYFNTKNSKSTEQYLN